MDKAVAAKRKGKDVSLALSLSFSLPPCKGRNELKEATREKKIRWQ